MNKKGKTKQIKVNKKKDGTANLTTLFFGNGRTDSEKIKGFGVILEGIQSSLLTVIEKVESLEASLTKKIEDGNKMLAERLDAIVLAAKLTPIETTVQHFDAKISGKIDNYEQRISVVETTA